MAAAGNLGACGQNRRLRTGVILFALSLALMGILLQAGSPRGYRALLFVPFGFAANAFFQGLHRTCTGLAAMGKRDLGEGPEAIVAPADLKEVRRLGMRTILDAAVAAAVLTALVLLV